MCLFYSTAHSNEEELFHIPGVTQGCFISFSESLMSYALSPLPI